MKWAIFKDNPKLVKIQYTGSHSQQSPNSPLPKASDKIRDQNYLVVRNYVKIASESKNEWRFSPLRYFLFSCAIKILGIAIA